MSLLEETLRTDERESLNFEANSKSSTDSDAEELLSFECSSGN